MRLGNQCNLKCVMCGPEYSNKWHSDAQVVYESQKDLYSKKWDIKEDIKQFIT